MNFVPEIVRRRFESRLGREAAYSLFAALVYAFNQWLLLAILYRYGGTSTGGWYAYAMAMIAPVAAFGGLGLRGILVTDARREFALGDYLLFRIGTSVLTLLTTIGLFFAMPRQNESGLTWAFVWLAIYRSLELVSDLLQGEFQRQGRMKVVFFGYVVKTGAGLGIFGAVMILWQRIDAAFMAMTLVALAVLLAFEFRPLALSRALELVWRPDMLRRLGILALPLGPVLLLGALQTSIPRWLLERYGSLEMLGVFAALAYLGVIANFVSSAVGTATSPVLSEHWTAGRFEAFRNLLVGVFAADLAISVACFGLFLTAGATLLRLMFNEEVARFAWCLPLVSLFFLAALWEAHLGCALTVLRRLRSTAVVQAVKVAVVTPVAVLLIKSWGVAGALLASAAYPLASLGVFALIVTRDYNNARKGRDGGKIPEASGALEHAVKAAS